MANLTWSEFLNAVDALLLTDAHRFGTTTAKAIQIKAAVKLLQSCVEKYRRGHQNLFVNDGTINSQLVSKGFVGIGELPDDCEPRDGFIVKQRVKGVNNAVDPVNDLLTVTAHGLAAAVGPDQVQIGDLRNTGGAVPAGAEVNRSYYLRVVDANTISLHLTAQGAINNDHRVDLTGDGTGVTTLNFGRIIFPVQSFPWKHRMELMTKVACMDGCHGLFTVNPNEDDPNSPFGEFWLCPVLPAGNDADGYQWSFELNWDGLKLEWGDNDVTPFDELAATQVAEYVKSWLLRHVDQDLKQSEAALVMSKNLKADLYLTGKRQREFKP